MVKELTHKQQYTIINRIKYTLSRGNPFMEVSFKFLDMCIKVRCLS